MRMIDQAFYFADNLLEILVRHFPATGMTWMTENIPLELMHPWFGRAAPAMEVAVRIWPRAVVPLARWIEGHPQDSVRRSQLWVNWIEWAKEPMTNLYLNDHTKYDNLMRELESATAHPMWVASVTQRIEQVLNARQVMALTDTATAT